MSKQEIAALQQRLAAVEAERDEYRDALRETTQNLGKAVFEADARAEAAERERDALREVLRTYGRHLPSCACADKLHYHGTGEEPICTCGLAQLTPSGTQP
jgi:predicted  nucleic acid-binding Zn-ribbon protein